MAMLIIVRHGQSTWNLENRFTGEVDVDLTPLGEEEAKNAGKLLVPYRIDHAYTSVLKRAVRSLEIILKETNNIQIPITKNAALNERNYGDLQGLNKSETEQKYGADTVMEWRRGFDIAPPNGESLKDTYARVIPYFQSEVEPKLRIGQDILIVAHGNSLRSLMMYIERITKEEIVNVNLATGKPRLYEFDDALGLLRCYYIE